MTEPIDDPLPDPSEFGESRDDLSATHGDFHHRPGFRGHDELLLHPDDVEDVDEEGDA